MSDNSSSEITLLKDTEWSIIDGELCRVISFVPMSSVKNGKVLALNKSTPYATINLECKKLLKKKITGFICHKMDFMYLLSAFKERGIKQDEELLIIWSKKHYKKYMNIFSAFMPRLWIMICPKGAFELETDQNYKPELIGEARWNATKPIIEWKPNVMR